jgi:DNA-binding beta-propeller fold protein YncE
MKKRLLETMKKTLMLMAGLVLTSTFAFGQYTPERVAGGARGLPAPVDEAYNVGIPGPMFVAPNGDIAWADYWDGNLMYWDAETGVIEMLIPRGTANVGIGGPISAATTGDRIMGITFDSENNILFSVANQVLKVDMSDRTLHHVVGSGGGGVPDFSLPAKEINLQGCAGLSLNHDESILYLNAISRNIVVAVDMVTEEVEIIVGIDGQRIDFSPAGLGTATLIREPFGQAYVKDPNTGEEWVYFSTQQKTNYAYNVQTKIVKPVAGTGAWNQSGDGGLALEATLLQPHDIAIDHENRYLYFGDHQGNHHGIRRVDLNTGIIERYTGIQSSPGLAEFRAAAATDPAARIGHRLELPTDRAVGVAIDNDGNLILGTRSPLIFKVDVETDMMELVAGYAAAPPPMGTAGVQATDMVTETWGVTVKDGRPYFFDIGTRSIIRLEEDGTTTHIAGNGETGFLGTTTTLKDAQFNAIRYMITDSEGNIFATDFGNHTVYKVDFINDEVTVVAGTGGSGFDAAHDGGPANAASMNQPHGIRLSPDESLLYIVDLNNRRVRVVDLETGIINTFAGTGNNGETNDPTPRLEANIQTPRDVVVDENGVVYVATSQHKKIYKIENDIVSVFTPKAFRQPFGLFLDEAEGLMWVSDELTVKTVDMATGEVFTVVEGPPSNWAIAKDGQDVYVSGRANGLYHFVVDAPDALTMIQGYADADDASALTIATLNEVGAATIELNLAAYQVAVADSTAATLPTVQSVQKLVANVNKQELDMVIAAVDAMAKANDASGLVLDHLAIAEIANVIDANLDAYQMVVAAAEGVADKAALQALVNTANTNASLAMIDAMAKADDASGLTYTLLRAAGAEGANVIQNNPVLDYLPYYIAGVEAAEGVATKEDLDAILVAANEAAMAALGPDALAAIDAMAKANDASGLTFKLMLDAGANTELFNYEFLVYYQAGVAAATGVADADALNAIITSANSAGEYAELATALAMIDAMAKANDASELTRAMLLAAGASNLKGDVPHFEEYQAGIEGAAGVADVAALQAIVDAANLKLAILKIVAFADAGDAEAMTGADLAEAGVEPSVIIPGNVGYYRTAVAEANGSDVDTSAKIQALIEATNAQVVVDAVEKIKAMAATGNAEELTVELLIEALMDFEDKYLDAYKNAVATAGELADAAAIQALLTFTTNCESIKEMAGTEASLGLTIDMLEELGIMYAFDILLEYYQEALFMAEGLEDCTSSIQELINETNFLFIQEMVDFQDASDLSIDLLVSVGVTGAVEENLEDYKLAVENAGSIDDLAALQALIDAVNEASEGDVLILNVKMRVWADYYEKFNAAEDFVDVAGTFNDWGSEPLVLTAVEGDPDLTYTITLDNLEVGVEYAFKFRINGSWDNDFHEFPAGGPDRLVTLEEGVNEYTYWFNDEDETTSVSDPSVASLTLYPNPAKETLNVTSDINIEEIRLVNMIGQVVHYQVVNNETLQISVGQFDKGIYLLQVLTSKGMTVERVVISR